MVHLSRHLSDSRSLFFKKMRWCRCPIRGWSPLYIISHYQSLSCIEESTELIPKPRLRAENLLSPSKCSLQEAMPMSCLQLGHNFKQTAVSAKRLPCCLLADSPERAREQRLQSLCRPGIDHMFALYLSIESRRLPKSARAIPAGIGIQRMNSAICGLSWPVGLSLYVMSNPSPVKTQRSVGHVREVRQLMFLLDSCTFSFAFIAPTALNSCLVLSRAVMGFLGLSLYIFLPPGRFGNPGVTNEVAI